MSYAVRDFLQELDLAPLQGELGEWRLERMSLQQPIWGARPSSLGELRSISSTRRGFYETVFWLKQPDTAFITIGREPGIEIAVMPWEWWSWSSVLVCHEQSGISPFHHSLKTWDSFSGMEHWDVVPWNQNGFIARMICTCVLPFHTYCVFGTHSLCFLRSYMFASSFIKWGW